MAELLHTINGPEDLKGLDDAQLAQVAQEVRELIIDTIGEIGGHFGANPVSYTHLTLPTILLV